MLTLPEIYFDASDYDAIASVRLTPADFKIEPELYMTKWFDYRVLHPVQATYLFADEYTQAARGYHKRNRDVRAAPFIKPYSGKDLFTLEPEPELRQITRGKNAGKFKRDKSPNVAKSVFKALWRARQSADRLGIPYRFYCEAVMRLANERGWKRTPSAMNLISTKAETSALQKEHGFEAVSVVDYVIACWQEHCKTRIVNAEIQHYNVDFDKGYIEQVQHRAFVMTQIKNRLSPEFSLGYALGAKIVKESECRKVFGDRTVDRAFQYILD